MCAVAAVLITNSNHHTAQAAANVNVVVNGVQKKMFCKAKEDIELTLDAARYKLGVPTTAILDLQQCLNMLLPLPYVAFMVDAMNRPQNSGSPTITFSDATVFFNVILNVHLYRCSPGTLFAELAYGPTSLYGVHPELVGAEEIFARCLNGLSFAPNSEHRGLEWAESQTFDSTLHDAAKCKSSSSSAITKSQMILYFLYSNNLTHISYIGLSASVTMFNMYILQVCGQTARRFFSTTTSRLFRRTMISMNSDPK